MAHKNQRGNEETGRSKVGAGAESPGAKPTQLTQLPRAGYSWLMMLNLKAFFFGGGGLLQDDKGT